MMMSILDCRNYTLGPGNRFVKLEFLLRPPAANPGALAPLLDFILHIFSPGYGIKI